MAIIIEFYEMLNDFSYTGYMIRKATIDDIPAVSAIYEAIHDGEESGEYVIGWKRGVYPTEKTALDSLARGDLFVLDEDGVQGAAIINQQQVDAYADASWSFKASDSEVMVLHTLVISPSASGKGLGKLFVSFYEEYAIENGCHYLRMDTNERNKRARAMYSKLGYKEAGIVPTVFNGIEGVGLVLLEKRISPGL